MDNTIKKRVLQVNLEGVGGAYSLMRNVENRIKDDFIFDYMCMGIFLNEKEAQMIAQSGGEIYELNLRKNRVFGHILLPIKLGLFFRDNKYKIVHIHADTSWKLFLYAFMAKKNHVPKVVVHSHATNVNGDFTSIKKILHILFKKYLRHIATDMVACSIEAAKWMYLAKDMQLVNIIHNGIDSDIYKFSPTVRESVRNKYNINTKFVLGHVGDYSPTKNVLFLFKLLILLGKEDYFLLLIGDGKYRLKYEKIAHELGIENSILFLGRTNYIANFYNAMDIFLLPSVNEAVPMSALEAQANGLKCILSTSISSEISVSDFTNFLDINHIDEWVDCIKKYHDRGSYRKKIDLNSIEKIDVSSTANCFKQLYQG